MYRICGVIALGMTMAVWNAGCGDRPGKGPKGKPKGQEEPGWVFGEPEEKHHVRLHIDTASKKATAKILDGDIKDLVPIAAPSIMLMIKGEKEPLVLEAQGEKGKPSAVFVVTHDKLGTKHDPKHMEVRILIEGKNVHFVIEDHKH